MLPLLIFLFTTTFFVWRFYKNAQSYWKNRGIDGPPPNFFLGNLWAVTDYCKPHALVMKEWGKKYGKVYGITEGVKKILVLSDPELLHELFVKKYEDFYGRKIPGSEVEEVRTLTSGSFSSNSLKKLLSTVEDSAVELLRLLEPNVNGEPVDMHEFFQEYTFDVISRIAMGQVESKMFKNKTLDIAKEFFNQKMRHPLILIGNSVPALRIVITRLLTTFGSLTVSTINPIFDIINKAVDERLEQRERDAADGMEPGEPQDFVDLFLDARAEGDIDGGMEFSKSNLKVSRNLTREELAAQLFLFLLAGYDTTSNTLSYASWLLAKHPEVQRKVQKEIDEVCGSDQVIGYDAQSKLKYTEAVIKETLRFYPIASGASARTAMKDSSLGGIHIEKGTVVQADVLSLHFDKSVWGQNADEFLPERWEDEKTKHNNAWIPFGSGPRICLGMRLAYIEAKIALAHLLRVHNFVLGPKSEKKLNLVGSTTMSPEAVTLYLKTRA